MNILLSIIDVLILGLLWNIGSTIQSTTQIIRLYNESMYPLTSTKAVASPVYPLTKPDPVNGDGIESSTSKNISPLHNGQPPAMKGGK